LITVTPEQVVLQVAFTYHLIQDLTGLNVKFFRPPYGSTNDKVLSILNGLGLTVVMWNRDANDWRVGENIVGNFIGWAAEPVKRGSISLQHDIYQNTVLPAGLAMDVIVKSGYKVVAMSECLRVPAYGRMRGDTGVDAVAVVSGVGAAVPGSINAGGIYEEATGGLAPVDGVLNDAATTSLMLVIFAIALLQI
jgi:hypothetical protein